MESNSGFENEGGERIAKFLARSGVASRRGAERLIEEGRIKVNGKTLTTAAFKVSEKDTVLFDNKPIAAKEPTRLWRYHKPPGLVTSHKDEQDRTTVFEKLPKEIGRVISIGRLDITSEGLLLLTNDGELARALELPSTGWQRKYRARAYGRVTQEELDTLMKGIKIDGIKTGPIEAELERQKGDNCWIAITLREGKNREVRRALDTLGLTVNRLIRISYGPFQLGGIPKEGIEEIKGKILRDQVGHLIDIPEFVPKPLGQRISKPKRGTHASAKRFANDTRATHPRKPKTPAEPKPMPTGRGKFAHKPKSNKSSEKSYGKPYAKPAGKPSGKPITGRPSSGKPSGKPSSARSGGKPSSKPSGRRR